MHNTDVIRIHSASIIDAGTMGVQITLFTFASSNSGVAYVIPWPRELHYNRITLCKIPCSAHFLHSKWCHFDCLFRRIPVVPIYNMFANAVIVCYGQIKSNQIYSTLDLPSKQHGKTSNVQLKRYMASSLEVHLHLNFSLH